MSSRLFGSISGYIKNSKMSVFQPSSKMDKKQKMVSVSASFPDRKKRKRVLAAEAIKD